MLAAVREELCGVSASGFAARRAEVAALLRFGGELCVRDGRLVIEAELPGRAVAARLCREVAELFGHVPQVWLLPAHGDEVSYRVRVDRDAEDLARQTGLLDARGRPVRGLPPAVVAGDLAAAAAIWRGALLARGVLGRPGRGAGLEVSAPGPEAALALVGAGRRLAVASRARAARGTDQVVVRDPEAITTLLERIGADHGARAYTHQQQQRLARDTSRRRVGFDDANQRRSVAAAHAAVTRVARARDILAGDAPAHLQVVAELRLAHPDASLAQLGQLSDPPMTKDAVAGRLRRLLALADTRAAGPGAPGTDHLPPAR